MNHFKKYFFSLRKLIKSQVIFENNMQHFLSFGTERFYSYKDKSDSLQTDCSDRKTDLSLLFNTFLLHVLKINKSNGVKVLE